MANRWNQETALKIFGMVMGNHFYNKWVYNGTTSDGKWEPDLGTMGLFYEMDNKYMQVLIDYVDKNYGS